MPLATPFRRNIVRAFLLVALLLGVSLLSGLYQAWLNHLEGQRSELFRDASTVSNYVQSTLIDASKLLDIAQQRLNADLASEKLTPERAQETLLDTVSAFSLYNTSDRFGLLFCTDKNGTFFAASSGLKNDALHFDDRFYFKDLETHPDKRLAIGNLVHTRTTKKDAFHMAMPLKDKRGNFAGVVIQQILEEDLSKQLEPMMTNSAARVYTYAANDKVGFVFPASELIQSNDQPDARRLLEIIDKNGASSAFIKVKANTIGLPETNYVEFAKSSKFGIYTVALISEREVISEFLTKNIFTVSYSLLAFIIASALFIRLYRQAVRLDNSQFTSNHDSLTGLNNRRCLDENFQNLWRDSMRSQKPISVLFMDIDHFKRVNDQYGHEIGDKVLKAVSVTIGKCLRRPLDLYCRWGGEEFVAVLPETPMAGAQLIAEEILRAVSSIELEAPPVKVTISIGIASMTVNSHNLHDDLIDMADRAMLQAKNEGRNRAVCFNTPAQ